MKPSQDIPIPTGRFADLAIDHPDESARVYGGVIRSRVRTAPRRSTAAASILVAAEIVSFGGRPPLRPRRRAAAKPAWIRFRIKLRSNFRQRAKHVKNQSPLRGRLSFSHYTRMSAFHLWTPPFRQGKTLEPLLRVVGCCHLSGL